MVFFSRWSVNILAYFHPSPDCSKSHFVLFFNQSLPPLHKSEWNLLDTDYHSKPVIHSTPIRKEFNKLWRKTCENIQKNWKNQSKTRILSQLQSLPFHLFEQVPVTRINSKTQRKSPEHPRVFGPRLRKIFFQKTSSSIFQEFVISSVFGTIQWRRPPILVVNGVHCTQLTSDMKDEKVNFHETFHFQLLCFHGTVFLIKKTSAVLGNNCCF